MKLLIVEDNATLAELTAELLHALDAPVQRLEAITLVSDLETALLCLPEYDAVLCDGAFPLATGSHYVVEEWDVIRQEACRRGIHFVLYSGSARALDCARESHTPAFAKPAVVEEIYAALLNFPLPVNDRGYGVSARMTGNLKPAGDEYVTSL